MAKNKDLIQQSDGNPEGDAPVEAWDAIIGHHESVILSYAHDLKKYKAGLKKGNKVNPKLEERIATNIRDHKVTVKILKGNRKKKFGM